MEIHNLMEDLVSDVVRELSSEDGHTDSPRYCRSEDCLQDAICYVLNRIPPRYVSSSRGLAHLTEEFITDPQLQIDVVRLAHEGLDRVTSVRREYYDVDTRPREADHPVFNFPTIKGRVFYGTTFEPAQGVNVELLLNEEPAEMVDARWQNPYHVSKRTPGTYVFWPDSTPADSVGQERVFPFEIRIKAEGYDEIRHLFQLTVKSEIRATAVVALTREYQVQDLYLFG